MIRAAIYNPTTGVIAQMIQSYDQAAIDATAQAMSMLALPAPDGVSDSSHYVKGGVFLPIPAKPRGSASFDLASGTWLRTLAVAKADAKNTIRTARNAAEYAGFTWNGWVFDSDSTAQARIQAEGMRAIIAQVANTAFSTEWTLADNTYQTLTKPQMLALVQALGVFIESLNTKAKAFKAQIDAATTLAQVDAVAWS